MVRCTRPVEYVFPKFTNDPAGQWARTPEHKEKNPAYPDPDHFLGPTQKYLFRAPELRHMRIGQVIRYFAPAGRAGQDKEEEAASAPQAEQPLSGAAASTARQLRRRRPGWRLSDMQAGASGT